ncbi:MAG TPA: L-lactate permease [Clostridia bacterium]
MKEVLVFIAAVLPILWLLVSLGRLKMPAHRASILALIGCILISATLFHMPATGILQASMEGLMLAVFPILWVIIAAIFAYNLTVETGSMEKIKNMLASVSPDRRVQGLILAFCFGGFLEGVAGFGTAVAIPAAIMVAMGFKPMKAATVCLIANTIPVAFGVLGVPIIALAQVTGLALDRLSLYTSLQLFALAVFLPLVLMFVITGKLASLKGVVLISVLSGLTFAVIQTLTAYFLAPELAAVAGSLLSLSVVVIYSRLSPVKTVWLFSDENQEEKPALMKIRFAAALQAWSPYLLILVIVLAIRLLPFMDFLNAYPFVLGQQFYFGAGGKPMSFALINSSGSIVFIAAIIGGLIQGATLRMLSKTFWKTILQVKKTLVTVIAIVALAKIMGYSGMMDAIANTLASVSGRFYPFIAPLLGAVGTFITGSDTSSNVLFGNLQQQSALKLGMNPEWLAAANASGATAGKMISPQSIAIAASATGQPDSEGKMLGKTILYCIVYVVLLGIIVFAFNPSTI